MADLRSILTDPNYTGANAATKRAIFERYSAQDPNYVNANEATKQAIQARYGVSAVAAAPVMTPEEQALAIAGGGGPAEPAPAQPFNLPRALLGAGETGLTLATGATTGLLGYGAGGVAGLLESIRNGTYGSSVGGNLMAKRAAQGMNLGTYQAMTPEAQAGLQTLSDVGEAAKLAPVPVTAVPQAMTQAAMQQARAAVPAVAAQTAQAAGRAADIIRRPAPTAPPGSVGAAATEQALQRATTAEMMPVPFTGGSALTKGQASRDFAQLQFEKETAKLQEVGAPLRERVQNQSATLLQNFDAMVDSMQPITLSKPEIGLAVTTAIQNKANVAKNRIRAEYKKAEEAGETEEPVSMAPVAKRLEDLDKYSGLVSIIPAFRREAERLGAVAVDEAGALVPQELSINNAEILRQFVNQGTDWANPREAKFAKQLVMAIDESTEPAGGEIYRRARNLRRQYAEEFENVGLTSALLGTKGNTSERKIAVENVFDKVIRLSPVEEMNKVRATLISAGPEGKRAWTDLKAKGIDFIRESSQTSARDESGNFVISPAALHKTIKAMDQTGKLEALYGKKQAQILRDLSEIALDIYTAPPGAVNMSNTGSAILNAADTVLTFGISGMPVAGKQVLLEAVQYVRNRQTRARVKDALAGPTRDKNLSESSRQTFATTSVGTTRQEQAKIPATEAVVEANLPTQMALRTVAAGDTVDGRVVREEIPNTGSISASLENYEVLPGVREVPISAFDPEYVNKITMDRLDDRTRRLAQEIQQSREINPLIVVQDSEGMYVLEGGHRFDALVASGAKSLPAMVVIDLDDPPAQAAK